MADITQHEWCDSQIQSADVTQNADRDVQLQLQLYLTFDAESPLYLDSNDSRALAEHFGLLPLWMTRAEFEAAYAGGDPWCFVKMDGNPAVRVARYIGNGSYRLNNRGAYGRDLSVTHVMPIPTPEPPK